MPTLTARRLGTVLLALAAAVGLILTLTPGSTAAAAGGHHSMHDEDDAADGFAISLPFLAGPATFTDNVSANFRVRYDQGRALSSNLPRDASNVLMVEATWDPDGTSGWHTHPGPGVITVVEGAVTVTNANDCVPRTYEAGEAFLDPGQGNVHIADNASPDEGARAVATFFGVPDGGPATNMVPPADC